MDPIRDYTKEKVIYVSRGDWGEEPSTIVWKGLSPGMVPVAIKRTKDRSGYRRERDALGRLTGYPNIVQMVDSFHEDPWYYMITTYEGEKDLPHCKDSLGLPDMLQRMSKISYALDHTHKCGIVHADVNPVNIRINGSTTTLIDFDLARGLYMPILTIGLEKPLYYWSARDRNSIITLAMPRLDIHSVGATIDNFAGDLLYGECWHGFLHSHSKEPRGADAEKLSRLLHRIMEETKTASDLAHLLEDSSGNPAFTRLS